MMGKKANREAALHTIQKRLCEGDEDMQAIGAYLEALHMMAFDALIHDDSRGAIQTVAQNGIDAWQRTFGRWDDAIREIRRVA